MQRLSLLSLALATAMVTASDTSQGAAGACPWIVLPTPATKAAAVAPPAYDIVFQGLGERTKVFYGFTVSSLDVAWELTNQQALPDLFLHGRRLEPAAEQTGATGYQLAEDSIEPHTIYLVAADTVVDKLEQIDARIEPAQPVAVSQLLPRTRGGSDLSGPLPHRSVPGVEIANTADQPRKATGAAAAELQICAYEIAVR